MAWYGFFGPVRAHGRQGTWITARVWQIYRRGRTVFLCWGGVNKAGVGGKGFVWAPGFPRTPEPRTYSTAEEARIAVARAIREKTERPRYHDAYKCLPGFRMPRPGR